MKNRFDLTGKVALVTGGSSGLGRHFALTLAAAGAAVAVAARRDDKVAEVASDIASAGGQAVRVALDVTNRESIADAFETVEREGRAILIASHLIDDIERVADRIVFLRHGVVEATGSTEELRDRFPRAQLPLLLVRHDETPPVVPVVLERERRASSQVDARPPRRVQVSGHAPRGAHLVRFILRQRTRVELYVAVPHRAPQDGLQVF